MVIFALHNIIWLVEEEEEEEEESVALEYMAVSAPV
jgi:hypothetical protein